MWKAEKGRTLRSVLTDWSKIEGVDLYWPMDYDYRLKDGATFSGNFDEAVGKLLDRFKAVRPQPFGQLHQGADSPRTLVINSYDLSH